MEFVDCKSNNEITRVNHRFCNPEMFGVYGILRMSGMRSKRVGWLIAQNAIAGKSGFLVVGILSFSIPAFSDALQ